jgi:alcohol dehydrogenase class IV
VTAFEFASGRIVFGVGRAADLATLAAEFGGKAFVVTGSDPARHEGIVGRLDHHAFSVSGEPTVDIARAATEAARSYGADLVIGVGGGSVLDLAKAVAMLLANGGDPLDYLEVIGRGQPVARESVPCVAVPTTAGTGSEVTANAVLASPEHGIKASLRSRFMLPRIALVDPLLAVGCPPAVTAASGLDALTQCLEPFVSVRANPVTDGFAREGLRRAGASLRPAYADGSDVPARTGMALCALFGGLALANAKLGAVHGLAGVVGGTVDVPHGAACAALLAPVVRANVAALPADSPYRERFVEIGRLLTGCPSIEDGIGWIEETVSLLGIRGLSGYGLRESEVDAVVDKAARSSSMQGNPVALTPQALRTALIAAL